jgi:tetratricopeptide (TPR) repeat protein
MGKSLRATTIIPDNLYVEREADRQLDKIIDDMGRPGYVLVARQMGKTNLLIHMKRRRESYGDIVTYFDLSNRFESARNLFRHVIDSIIESSPSRFGDLSRIILEQRINAEADANIEYDRHLRMLLRAAASYKVIIVLDEIDSLTSVPYSDLFFAQIRSMYFSRINHPEYERLTYVLSGVAEPSDLIKDKNISPFNIGEKIYLDDFNKVEFSQLITKAGLTFSQEVIDEVYDWTSGNPRMSWDVCSHLEDIMLAGSRIKRADVPFVVEKLYLTHFDQAPVDHIRVLAESDAQIRSAIMSIRRGKEDTLDEKIKNRLYLAGISRSNPGQHAKIKNRIIDAALSDAWLNQVAISHKGMLEVAADHFDAGRYKEAIGLIEEYLQLSAVDQKIPITAKFQLGVAKYFVENYESAIRNLKAALEGDLNEESRGTCNYYLAMALLRDGQIEESVAHFRTSSSYVGRFQRSAKLAVGSALIALDVKKYYAEIMQINEEIISEVGSAPEKESIRENIEILAAANYNIAQVYDLTGSSEAAYECFAKSLAVAPTNFKPAILLRQSQSRDDAARSRACFEAFELVLENKLKIPQAEASAIDFSEGTLATILLQLHLAGRKDQFRTLLEYSQREIYDGLLEPFDILLKLYRLHSRRPAWIELVRIAIDEYADERTKSDELFYAHRQLVQYSESPRRERAISVYLQLLQDRLDQSAPINADDFVALLNYGSRLINQREYRRAAKVLSLAHSVAESTPEVESFLLAVRWYQEFLVRSSLHEIDLAKEAAKALLKAVEVMKSEAKDSVYGDAVATFSEAATTFLSESPKEELPKIGRNERIAVKNILTGNIFEAKFKKVEAGLREGLYTVVERAIERKSQR